MDGVKLLSHNNSNSIVSFVIDEISPFDIGLLLGQKGVCVRVGKHCAEPLHQRFGVDSSMHHAAKAFWKQALVIWSWTDAWRFGYSSHINLRNDEPYEYVPFRLGVDFNTDIVNQHTNIYTKEFLDGAVDKFLLMVKGFNI